MKMFIVKKIAATALKKLFDAIVGFSFYCGSILAVIISWNANSSILLALGHGILGWIYVLSVTEHYISLSLFCSIVVFLLIRAGKKSTLLYKMLSSLSSRIE
jgi:hypothetical protein